MDGHIVVEYSMAKYTTVVLEHTASYYTLVVEEKIAVAVAQTMMVSAMETSPFVCVLRPSCSTYPFSFVEARHMLDNPSIHD